MSRLEMACVGLALAGFTVTGAAAQTTDTLATSTAVTLTDSLRVLVEYVGGSNLYLAAGSEAGLATGDTVVARNARGTDEGRLRVISASQGRSVAAFVGTPFPITRGDSLTLHLPSAVRPAVSPSVEVSPDSVADTRGEQPRTSARPPPTSARPPRRPPSLSGSVAIDLDATSSQATGTSADVGDPWRFVTPTVRLNASARGLPGGVRVMVNTSLARFYTTGSPGAGRPDQIRVYQAEVQKSFEGAPVQLRAGRFFDGHDLWGGYLDGASVRIGGTGNGAGLGVSAGLSPIGSEQTLFSGESRLTVFGDFRHRAGSFTYDMDVAFTRRLTLDDEAERYVGLTQRFRVSSASLYQRSQVRFDAVTGSPRLAQIDLIGNLPLGSGWMIRAQYALRSYDWIASSVANVVQRRERIGGGVVWAGRAGSLSVDAELMRRGDRPRAPLYSGSLYLPRLLGPFGLVASGGVNRDREIESAYMASGVLLQAGSVRGEATWRLYRTRTAAFDSETRGASFSLSFPLRPGVEAMFRGSLQSGAGSSSQRLYTGLWASF